MKRLGCRETTFFFYFFLLVTPPLFLIKEKTLKSKDIKKRKDCYDQGQRTKESFLFEDKGESGAFVGGFKGDMTSGTFDNMLGDSKT